MPTKSIEELWVESIRKFFQNDHKEEEELDRLISIFNVPKALKDVKPEAYTPQMVAMGPYHHFREDMYAMEQNKLIVARKVQNLFKSLKFNDLVEKLRQAMFKIRACYHKFLTLDGDVLAWMMTIDGLFLLQFLHIFVNRNESVLALSARMSFLVDSKGRKLGYDTVLKDIMMLENQIPLFVMKKILKLQCSTIDLAESMLPRMLLGVCNEISPLKLKEDYPLPQILKRAHLLDVLYHLTVPSYEDYQHAPSKVHSIYIGDYEKGEKQGCFGGSDNVDVSAKFKDVWGKVSHLSVFQKIANGPLRIVTAFVPVVTTAAEHLGLSSSKEKDTNGDDDNSNNKAPRVEEIMIPSVSVLAGLGVEFRPTQGDVSTVEFDNKTKTFYLPVVQLDVNSEVILRNLVAYEASAISGPLVLARYTELMNGIVDTAQDAKILADKGIIKSDFKYQEVADIWNGMSKSIRLSYVPYIDKTIKEVNQFSYSQRKVKYYMKMKAYIYGSWRMLALLGSLLVIALMFIQSFCSVYDCPRTFHLEPAPKK